MTYIQADISLEDIQSQLIQCGTVPAETHEINIIGQVPLEVPVGMFIVGSLLIVFILLYARFEPLDTEHDKNN